MEKAKLEEISKAFNDYKDLIFTIENDLAFWRSFLEVAINDAATKFPSDQELYSSIFTIHDRSPIEIEGYLKTHETGFHLTLPDLENKRKQFFHWILNLSILKSYNALETFLMEVIRLAYIPSCNNRVESKKVISTLQNEVNLFLKAQNQKPDNTNNRNLISFLKLKSDVLTSFWGQPMNVDLKTSWEAFFEMISILRNTVAHYGMIMSADTVNNIKSISKDVFERYFFLVSQSKESYVLSPKEEYFRDFLGCINAFAANSAKFAFEQKDLSFLKMN